MEEKLRCASCMQTHIKYDLRHECANVSDISRLSMLELSNYAQKPPKFHINWLSIFEYANNISQDPSN